MKPDPKPEIVSSQATEAMLDHFRRRVGGQLSLETARHSLQTGRTTAGLHASQIRSAGDAQKWVSLTQAMLDAGRLTQAEALLYRTFSINHLHESRWSDGEYGNELDPISKAMKKIENDYGLTEDQYFRTSDAPDDWLVLSATYDRIMDEKFEASLREFGLDADADLWRDDRVEFEKLRESGRLSVFEASNAEKAISSSILIYEREATLCSQVEAHYAACVMLGSAAEGRLVLACLQRPAECKAAYDALPKTAKSRNPDPLSWSLDHLISVASAAGWIKSLEHDDIVFIVSGWLENLRITRNLLHPGRHAKERPHVAIGYEAYADASAAYSALRVCLDYPDGIDVNGNRILPYAGEIPTRAG
jgi:hypothetical protein